MASARTLSGKQKLGVTALALLPALVGVAAAFSGGGGNGPSGSNGPGARSPATQTNQANVVRSSNGKEDLTFEADQTTVHLGYQGVCDREVTVEIDNLRFSTTELRRGLPAVAKAKQAEAAAIEKLAREQQMAAREVRERFSLPLGDHERRVVEIPLEANRFSEDWTIPLDGGFNIHFEAKIFVAVSKQLRGNDFRVVDIPLGMSDEQKAKVGRMLTSSGWLRLRFRASEPDQVVVLSLWDKDYPEEQCRIYP
ncbi:MAG: hypothetical protein COU09_00890 [Candidatus Harrisonbacteria bacterium CG10_big_fil_rev_8_21_14_0_10_44_23]|uniref:Uncharacterized protein n=1 Tax=Candidatus Harrisonbacteria bacterium CG10_big_fil_rev_8_21_14_0_10_44_23 TaxID=1974585 RepID=A0A2H0UQN7_9BACT|nr:MAG: hypothetical protein COU09_00890 [Candidatus Harrisonbacteria bacterium CG10_big_fil_rev_8_21_14_0_10_44_23]